MNPMTRNKAIGKFVATGLDRKAARHLEFIPLRKLMLNSLNTRI